MVKDSDHSDSTIGKLIHQRTWRYSAQLAYRHSCCREAHPIEHSRWIWGFCCSRLISFQTWGDFQGRISKLPCYGHRICVASLHQSGVKFPKMLQDLIRQHTLERAALQRQSGTFGSRCTPCMLIYFVLHCCTRASFGCRGGN